MTSSEAGDRIDPEVAVEEMRALVPLGEHDAEAFDELAYVAAAEEDPLRMAAVLALLRPNLVPSFDVRASVIEQFDYWSPRAHVAGLCTAAPIVDRDALAHALRAQLGSPDYVEELGRHLAGDELAATALRLVLETLARDAAEHAGEARALLDGLPES